MNNLIILGQAAAALLAIVSLLSLLVKYAIVKPIKAYIDQATKQISPNANGGRSLNDLVDKVDDLKVMVLTHLRHHDTPAK